MQKQRKKPITLEVHEQIVAIRQEISLMTRVGCSCCGKTLATRGADGTIIVKCARCKTMNVIR